MHDTEGWKSLETSMRILQHIIEAVGNRLYKFDMSRVLAVVEKGVLHINRFVREISHFVIGAIFITSETVLGSELESVFRGLCDRLVPIVV